jgi:hypothetical protein
MDVEVEFEEEIEVDRSDWTEEECAAFSYFCRSQWVLREYMQSGKTCRFHDLAECNVGRVTAVEVRQNLIRFDLDCAFP